MLQTFESAAPFPLENGEVLPSVSIAYTTYGKLNANRSNVIWICHALTANADPAEWWKGVVGAGGAIDPDKHFIVCANILGSCYGSTGPTTVNPQTGKPYFSRFPPLTIRDMVQAHILLRLALGIGKISMLMGGSMGGYQVLEWCVMEPLVMEKIYLVTTSASESAWGIAVHATQRLAIEADATWKDERNDAGKNGMKAARAIGMLTYRNYRIMVRNQTDEDVEKLDNYRAASYINYQGDKLVTRFNAQSYWLLTKAMDTHHLARGRNGSLADILRTIEHPALIMGIDSDILCPIHEQEFLASHMPNAKLVLIDSDYGHDGFLVEIEKINQALSVFM